MRAGLIVLVVFATLDGISTLPRNEKNLAIFNVVKFKNEPCYSTSETMNNGNRNGTCFTSTECEEKNGRAEGNCASGFGICCVFTKETCGEKVNQNSTYIRNEDYPTAVTTAGSCEYEVEKCDENVCTLRLDFEEFTLDSWAATASDDSGYICSDTFVVSDLDTGAVVPTICGENTGQHMFIDLGKGSSSGAKLTFTFGAGTSVTDRLFEIRVTQLYCDNPSRPPEGCLQYFVGTEGRLKSFNWDGGNGHLESQAYTMCIRQEKGFCCNKYSLCSTETFFTLGLHMMTATPGMAQTDGLCTQDYVIIEGSSSQCGNLNPNTNRYCGNNLNDYVMAVANTEICDCTTPFEVTVITNAAADGIDGPANDANDVPSKGVCLDYVQIPCA